MIDDRLISNDFFNYNFEGYELRSDQIIDFGDGLNAESLIFTTFKGVDWMEANYSHYFQVKHWKVDQTFEEVVTGPSWFTHFHDEIADRHQEYFYTESGYPAYLVISWRKNDKIAGDFYDYFYSLLIDGTTENYRHLEKQSYFLGSKPWLEVWMQSLVGVGSNLPVSRKLSEITGMIKEIANKVVITGGIPKSQVDRENFDLMATNSSPFSFINSMSLGNKWEFSEWLGTFYKSRAPTGYTMKISVGFITRNLPHPHLGAGVPFLTGFGFPKILTPMFFYTVENGCIWIEIRRLIHSWSMILNKKNGPACP